MEEHKRKGIEEKARQTLEDANDKNDAMVDIINIANNLGFTVYNVEMEDSEDGFILVNEKENNIFGQETSKLIGVNLTRSAEWKRFIIAHEIGHYILYYNEEKNNGMFAHREHKTGKDEFENEIDFFAASLLVPAERFKKNLNELKKANLTKKEIIFILAERFRVERKIIERRFGELGLNE